MKVIKNKFTQQSFFNPFYKLGFGIYLGFRIWNLGFISPVQAQSTSLRISPPVVEIMLAPGKKMTQTFTLKSSSNDLSITPTLHLARPDGDTGHITLDPHQVAPSSIPLIFALSGPPDSPTLTLESASVDAAQDIYLALVFETQSPPDSIESKGQTTLTPSIAALILVTLNPSGVTPINLDILDFNLPFIHDSWSPLSLSPLAQNKSPIMIRPTGHWVISGPSGREVFKRDLYPNLILGDSSRKIFLLGEGCSGIEGAKCDSEVPLTWQPKWSNLGPHRLTLTLNTLGGTKITQIEKTIWVFPVRQTILIFAIIFLILVLVFNTRRNFRQKLLDSPPEKQ